MKTTIVILIAMFPALLCAHSLPLIHDVYTGDGADIVKIREWMQSARQEADPEYYAIARDMISRVKAKTAETQLYQAEVQQYFHQFDTALETLSDLGHSANADILRANIYYTQGRYLEQQVSCKQLFGEVDQLTALTCVSQATSLTGKLEKSYQLLSRAAELGQGSDPQTLHWAYVTLAEMSERLNQLDTAADWYAKALELQAQDVATRLAYADILLSLNKNSEAIQITQDYLQHDLLLLRYVRAQGLTAADTKNVDLIELERRVTSYSGDKPHMHYDFVAEYHIYFSHDYAAALKWAQKHWQGQKTPRDTRLLARASRLAGAVKTQLAVASWRAKLSVEDAQLDQLLGHQLASRD